MKRLISTALSITLSLSLLTTGVQAHDHEKQSSTKKAETTSVEIKSKYQRPTFTGSGPVERQALLQQLTSGKPLSNAEQRQLMLLQLAMFANAKEQSLKPLEAIADSLQAYLKVMKNDYEIMAALGSALSLQSIFYQRNLGKMNFLARKGMRYMDRAVKKSPDHLGIRLLRGLSYANMPAFLNRASFAEKDLSLLKAQMAVHSDAAFSEFIDYFLAMALVKNKKADQAKSLWTQLADNKTSVWASKASEQLKGHF